MSDESPLRASGDDSGQAPTRLDLAPGLLRAFVTEGTEQLAGLDENLQKIRKQPEDKQTLHALLRPVHTIGALAGFLQLAQLKSVANATEDLLEGVRCGRLGLEGETMDLMSEATQVLGQLVKQVAECLPPGSWPPSAAVGVSALIERMQARVRPAAAAPPPTAPRRRDSRRPDPNADEAATRSSPISDRSLRVDAERLDHLVDLVGELVITQSMVSRASHCGDAGLRDLRRHMLRLDKITRELHELAGSLRLVPVQGLFRKMARLARDVAKKSGKRLSFEVSGEETEVDKSLVEKVADPLVHLLRNAIDHGLEGDPLERIRRGKPEAGRVCLRAMHRGGTIQIEVEDDGRGLNRDAIMAKAVELGLLRPSDTPTDSDVFALICEPGLSTASRVTALSGRGIGMDVVKRNIGTMGGVLDISSRPGLGTRFTMKLPLTLAVIDGMLVRAGKERYVVPTLSIVRLVEPREADATTVIDKQDLLNVRGELLPMIHLNQLFGFSPERSLGRPPLAVIAEYDGMRAAVLVDEVIGQHQAVIKSLGRGIGETRGISGCAILPDGRVGLVLDVGGLMNLASSAPGANAGVSEQAKDSAWMS